MTYTEIGGARFNYRLDGTPDAPVVVFSNSLGTNLAMWDAQIPALTQEFRVLRYDARGHGESDVTTGPYTIEGLGRDVIGLLDALKISTAHYCGLSVGGFIGQWLGIHAPQRFKSLTLCNTAARIGTTDGWNTRMSTVHEGGMAGHREWRNLPLVHRRVRKASARDGGAHAPNAAALTARRIRRHLRGDTR